MTKYSNSRIQCFKSCRRLYKLRYIDCVFPKEKAESLQTGSSYHEKVEMINKTGNFVKDGNPKTNAMARAYMEFILPKLGGKVIDAERWWENSDGVNHYCGIIDAVREDGVPIEFKTTSGPIDGSYWLGLENDEQILMYLHATYKERIVYAVIQVPTLRQKKDETDEEFEERCFEWYDESKAQVNELTRPFNRIIQFAEQVTTVVDDIKRAEHSYKVLGDCVYYPNPNNCRKWGRLCEYAPICNDFDPNKEYVEFEVRKDGETANPAH